MSRKTDIETELKRIFGEKWSTRDGHKVPDGADIKLSNDTVLLDATVLYADISESTQLVDGYKRHFAAEAYKAFLQCSVRVIRAQGGVITAYDGDRVMAVYIGKSKNTSAVKTGLQINWAVKNILQPALNKQYPASGYLLKHTVGIDTSDLWVINTGVRGNHDLAWIGRCANHAAKLCSLSHDFPTWISEDVYRNLHESAKSSDGRSMWESRKWSAMKDRTIYRSTWSQSFD